MTETPRATSLPSSSDAEPYVPLSWMGVAAFGSAILLVVLLLILAADSFYKKRPLLELELVLIGIAVVVVLSFIGRRRIRDAEGTLSARALGIDLCSAAWWTALVVGAIYGAYWLAITIPLQNEVQSQVSKMVENLNQGNVGAAFHQTLPPGSGVAPGDVASMEARYRRNFLAFRKSPIVQTALRNKGECRYDSGSMRDTEFSTGLMTCTAGGTLISPEGRLTLTVPLRAIDLVRGDQEKVTGGRQWQIMPEPDGYVTTGQFTPYGWAINDVINKGIETGFSFLNTQSTGTTARLDAAPHAAAASWGVLAHYPPDWLDRASDKLFTLPGGAAPSEPQRALFRRMWRTIGLLATGTRLKDYADTATPLTVTDSGLELSIAVEAPLPGEEGNPGAAIGRLVLVSNDASLLARLKELKAAANPDRVTDQPPTDLNLPAPNWRVLRIESNLQFIEMSRPQSAQPGS